MPNKALSMCAILLAALLSSQQASSVEPLSTKELAEHCVHYVEDPEGKDAIYAVLRRDYPCAADDEE